MKHKIRNAIFFGLLLFVVLGLLDYITMPDTTPAMIQDAESLAFESIGMLPTNTFVYDGCSLWFDFLLWHDFTSACLAHDMRYWFGGEKSERKIADVALRDTISHTGPLGPSISSVMYVGVRLFGNSALSKALDVNWGYGWNE